MSQNLKKKLISIQIKMAQDKRDNDSRRSSLLSTPIDSGVACLMRCRTPSKEFGKRALRQFLNRLRMRVTASADISPPDPCYKVVYLGNVLTSWAKGENCVEKPLSTLWRNYTQSSRADVRMTLVVSGGGLRATTRDHGLTEYWANRISFCAAPATFPRLFCWVYRHEGRRLRHELRCHAVLCSSASVARKLAIQLRTSLAQALAEFKRDKINRQNARLSLVNSCYDNPSMPRRKILLSTGSNNYRPPLERSKSAPKLTMIEEDLVEEESEDTFEAKRYSEMIKTHRVPPHLRHLRHYDSASLLLDKNYKTKYDFPKKDLASRLPPLQPKQPLNIQTNSNNNNNNYNNNSNLTNSHLTKEINIKTSQVITEENEEAPEEPNQPFSKRNFSLRKCKTRQSKKNLKNIQVNNTCEDVDDELMPTELKELANELENIVDENKELLEELLTESLTLDLKNSDDQLEARMWLDSDEGSLSSGCESAGTGASDFEQCTQSQNENDNEVFIKSESDLYESDINKKPVEFKLGGSVLARVRSLERLASSCNTGVRTFQNYIPEMDDVSLIPVGEMGSDFSSLKIFKKKIESVGAETFQLKEQDESCEDADENASSCSDESGYVELLESNVEHKTELVS